MSTTLDITRSRRLWRIRNPFSREFALLTDLNYTTLRYLFGECSLHICQTMPARISRRHLCLQVSAGGKEIWID